ncbi:MAG: TetR family transcriptional regulator [Propioniciclava sp.]
MDSADLTAEARIREAAIVLFGDRGICGTTVRAVAQAVGVSPALVIHHFESKEGLRAACDQRVLEQLAASESEALADPGSVNPFTQLAAMDTVIRYLNASLIEGGPGADRLFGQLCDLTATYFTSGQMPVKDTTDLEATAAVAVAFSCGASMLGTQIAHRLGGEDLADPTVYARYALASVEMLTHGLLADESWLTLTRQAIAAALIADPDPPPAPEQSGHLAES